MERAAMNNKFPTPELLLHPNIPKPLHGCAPRVVKGSKWWDEKRRDAYARHQDRCWACGVHKSQQKGKTKWLEAHECYEIDYVRGRMELVEVAALCHYCHNFIHSGRLNILEREGEVSHAEAELIREHGRNLIKGLTKPPPPLLMAKWSRWRMVVDGKEYGPTTPDFDAWSRGEWKNWTPNNSESHQ